MAIEVPQGGVATFSVLGEGSTPMTFRWRRNGTVLTNMILDRKIAVYSITNVQAANAGLYTVQLTNIAGAALTTTGVQLVVLADADHDGIPDDWETRYGLKPGDPADGVLDSDGDGMTNLAEYLAGTDPTDRSSYLKLDGIDADDSGVGLEFFARSNHTYSIQYRTALQETSWRTLTSVTARVTNRVERVVDPAVQIPQRYYRLATPASQVP